MSILFSSRSAFRSRRGVSAPARRRRAALLRRVACALCAGLLAWSVTGAIYSRGRTYAIVVTVRPVARGEIIDDTMIVARKTASDDIARHAWSADDIADLAGLAAQTDIAQGEPILSGMVSATPLATDGLTLLDVPLASSPIQLTVGQKVMLIASRPCTADDSGTSCVLCDDALVIETPVETDITGKDATVTFALTPDDALALIAMGDAPIIAASATDTPADTSAGVSSAVSGS